MQKSGNESGNNDTKRVILATYGIIPCNSNPSSSAKKRLTAFAVGRFLHGGDSNRSNAIFEVRNVKKMHHYRKCDGETGGHYDPKTDQIQQ